MYGKRGNQTLSEGSVGPLRLAQHGELVSRLSGGRYTEAALAGRLFSAANQAAVATTAALATTWTGLALCNPAGTSKNLVVHEFGYALAVAGPAIGAVGLMSSDNTGLAANITPKCAMNGAGTSIAIVDDGATIATPILERVFGSYGTVAMSSASVLGPFIYTVDGSIVLPPGRSILTYTTTACTAAFVFSFLWEEVAA